MAKYVCKYNRFPHYLRRSSNPQGVGANVKFYKVFSWRVNSCIPLVACVICQSEVLRIGVLARGRTCCISDVTTIHNAAGDTQHIFNLQEVDRVAV